MWYILMKIPGNLDGKLGSCRSLRRFTLGIIFFPNIK